MRAMTNRITTPKKLKNLLTHLEKRVQYQLSGRETTGTDLKEPGAKQENEMKTINITTADELIAMSIDPWLKVTATLSITKQAVKILRSRLDSACDAEPSDLVREYKLINAAATAIAECEKYCTDSDQRAMRGEVEKLSRIAEQTGPQATMLDLYRRFATAEQHASVTAAINAV